MWVVAWVSGAEQGEKPTDIAVGEEQMPVVNGLSQGTEGKEIPYANLVVVVAVALQLVWGRETSERSIEW